MSEFVPDEAVGEVLDPAPASADVSQEEAPAPAAEATVDYEALAAERTADLQRLQAEYMNYKKRVDRDRGLAKQAGVESVLSDLLPVLDAITLAKEHDDLAHGAQLIVAELEKVATKHGLVGFGEVGEPFDPAKHDALMQAPMTEPVEVVTVSQVIQLGYELAGRVIRPARVAVANP
ncbi:nucleotide exchange factor GrpE [Tessaracoccus sp. OH4464_COT-324]|uniref:nucleotide exchange factor GrpE n=1 Tax=Tessaracoccus sp. OH4464_COT-324 TaxID=2491059 RepID=UPI000F6395A2|nr:nucleotide exchange factor GrpE [Tessaracoccus sp. OH4464_COT-324]